MYLFLIFLSVIMVFSSGEESDSKNLQDYSSRCQNGRTIYIYLTTGSGLSDSFVSMIANNNVVNCTFEIHVKTNNYIIGVLEFPDFRPTELACSSDKSTVIMVSDFSSANVCKDLEDRKASIYHLASKNKISIIVSSSGHLNTLKITATSLRAPKFLKCSLPKEIECVYESQIFCIVADVLCDGNYNCGQKYRFDEDEEICNGSKLTPWMVLYTIIMGSVLFWLMYSITVALLPKRKETFVYKLDQAMSLYDSERVNVEINIQVLFPTETTTLVSPKKKKKGSNKSEKSMSNK